MIAHARAVLFLVFIVATTPAVARALPSQLDLYVGDSRVLQVNPVRVAVGNGAVISVTTLPAGELLLLGESAGRTTVQLWLKDGSQHRIVVDVAANDMEATLRTVRELLAGVEGVGARPIGHRIVLDGLAAGTRAQDRAAAVASLYPGVVLNFVGKVAWESMIHFDVRIVEVRRSALREVGIRWRDDIAGPEAGIAADLVANDPGRAKIWPPKLHLGWAASLDSRIRLLEQRGDALVVAEPMLSCRSGGNARFVSGGELPIPVIDPQGGADVEYKEYGVILDVKPVAEPDGAIYAHIDTEVSEVDDAQRVLGVPGLLKRRSATEVNLREGETLVIAGLVNRNRSGDRRQIPGLGSLPIVGGAFRTRTRRGLDSELAIFITPRIVVAERIGGGAIETPGEASERLRQRADGLVRELAPRAPPPP
jgi:pilus assembly protein CpaC